MSYSALARRKSEVAAAPKRSQRSAESAPGQPLGTTPIHDSSRASGSMPQVVDCMDTFQHSATQSRVPANGGQRYRRESTPGAAAQAPLAPLADNVRVRRVALPRSSLKDRPAVPLSSVLSKAPHLFTRNKISVVERYITDIDSLPDRYRDIQTLYMSSNSLESLKGIAQFQHLRSLSLANNCIADYLELEEIHQSCPLLESLILEGNPMSSAPAYRSQVLLRLPNLKVLDGEKVTEKERDQALSSVRQEQGMLDVVISNSCLLHKLGVISRLQQVHMQMRSLLFGKMSALDSRADVNACAPQSMHRLLQLWDYEGSLSAEERLLLGIEAQTMAKKYISVGTGRDEESWRSAFCQVIAEQQVTTASLMARIEEQHAQALAHWQSYQGSGGSSTLSELRTSHGNAIRELSNDREALISQYRETAFSLMDGVVEQDKGHRSEAETVEQACTTARSPNRLHQSSKSDQRRALGDISNSTDLAVSRSDQCHPQSQAIVDAQNRHRYSQGAGKVSGSSELVQLHSDEIQGLSQLLSQVSQLQGDLEHHVQGEMHLQNINMQLRQMLEATQRKLEVSGENQPPSGSVSEADLRDLCQGMEEALEAQHRLEERTRRLTHEKQMIEETARKAAVAAQAAEEAALAAAQERDALKIALQHAHEGSTPAKLAESFSLDLSIRNRQLEEELQRLKAMMKLPEYPSNDELRLLKLERESLGNLCKEQNDHLQWHQEQLGAVNLELCALKAQEQQRAAVQQLASRVLLRRAWLRFTDGVMDAAVRLNQHQLACKQHGSSLQRHWIRLWLVATRRSQRIDLMIVRRERTLIESAICAMMSHVAAAKIARVNDEVASQVRPLWLRRGALAAWKLWVDITAQIDVPECNKDPMSWRRRRVSHAALVSWRRWLSDYVLPQKETQAWADMQYRASLMRSAFVALKAACVSRMEKRVRTQAADRFRKAKIVAAWREGLQLQKAKRAWQLGVVQFHRLRLLRTAFREFTAVVAKLAKQARHLHDLRARAESRLALKAWRVWLLETRREFTARKVYAARLAAAKAAVRAIARGRAASLVGLAFREWHHAGQAIAQQRLQQGMLLGMVDKHRLRCLISAWRRQSSVSVNARALQKAEEERSLMSMQHSQAVAVLTDKVEEAQAREREALQLAGELEAALVKATESERNLRSELRELSAADSSRSAEISHGMRQLDSCLQDHKLRLAEMEDQLGEKERLLQACESSLADTVARLDVVVAERQSQSALLEDSISELKDKLSSAETRSRGLSSEVDKLQSALLENETALSAVASENSYFQTRIVDLEEELAEERRKLQLASSQADISRQSRNELDFARRQISDCESEIESLKRENAGLAAAAKRTAVAATVEDHSSGFRSILRSVAEDPSTPDRLRRTMASTLPTDRTTVVNRRNDEGSNQRGTSIPAHSPTTKVAQRGSKPVTTKPDVGVSRAVDQCEATPNGVSPSARFGASTSTLSHSNAPSHQAEPVLLSPNHAVRANLSVMADDSSSDLTRSEMKQVSSLRDHIQSLQSRITRYNSSASPLASPHKVHGSN